ncbi:MAG: DUF1801 domain-containing protein [Rhizobiaceae bacterium]
MSDNKTVPTDVDPRAFVEAVEHKGRREDALLLLDLFGRVTGYEPQMWGPSIVGFGRYHYRYATGREGEFLLTGFSPRKAAMTVYIMPGFKKYASQLKRLGKHKHSVSCLYLGRLGGLDLGALEEMIADSVERMKAMSVEHWPK